MTDGSESELVHSTFFGEVKVLHEVYANTETN
jgi:hypothetical protein